MSLLAAAGIDHGHGRLTAAGERSEERTLDWRILRRVLGYTRPYAAKRNTIFALTLLRAAQKPALAWAIAAVINGPISTGSYHGVLVGAGAFFALALFTELTFHFRQRLALELGEAVVHDLRNAVFQHLQAMPMSYFTRTKLGRILSQVITDIEAVRRGVQNVFFFSLLLFGQMLGAAALMLYYNWVLFLVLLAIGPLVWLVNRHFHPQLSRFSRAVAESQSRLTGTLAETIRGMRVIQGFTRQGRNEAAFGELVDRHASNNADLAQASSLYVPLLDLNSQLFTAALLVVGGWGALHGVAGMEVGSLIAFFFLPNLFFQSLQHLAQLYTHVVTAMAGAERVFRLLDQQPEWTDASDAIDLPDPRGQDRFGAASPSARGPDERGGIAASPAGTAREWVAEVTAPWEPRRPRNHGSDKRGEGTASPESVHPSTGARVTFRNVSFAYDEGRPVLHDISFTAQPGESIALVGHTGSGKTTIVNLLAKFYQPHAGAVVIDGYNLNQVRGDSLRAQMGIVLQTNFLFTGSVLENIRIGRPDASEDQVRAAAATLDCLDLIDSLPRGLATEVGERGTSLSLGQRQLICFTRALLANPRILILDEATSAVDTITESRLQRSLERLLRGRTSFVVAHRLSTIRRADQILVLDQGRIVERGEHYELLGRAGPYRSLYQQFVIADEEEEA